MPRPHTLEAYGLMVRDMEGIDVLTSVRPRTLDAYGLIQAAPACEQNADQTRL